MDNNSNSLKIAFMYIAIFLLVILIAIPPIFRIVFSNTKQTATNNNQRIMFLNGITLHKK